MNITTVPNLVAHGCTDRDRADPPVGPTVHDLVASLTTLRPFEVTEPPSDAALAGYEGQHFEWAVPANGLCPDGELHSWFSPLNDHGDIAFRGYDDKHVEEFWILDVDGQRLMVSAMSSPESGEDDLAELQGIVDSIRVVR